MFEDQLSLWFRRPDLLRALFMLNITEGSATPVPMECLRACSDLWTPTLKDCILESRGRIDNNVVSELTQLCRDISSLDLSQSNDLTDAGLAHLRELQQLTSLDLFGCNKITDDGLAHLKEVKRLKVMI